MTFQEQMILWSFTTPLGVAVFTGWKEKGIVGALIGLLVGAILGTAGFWGAKRGARFMTSHPKLGNDNPSLGSVILLSIALIGWLLALVFLGQVATGSAIS
jgi:hypothetical protein